MKKLFYLAIAVLAVILIYIAIQKRVQTITESQPVIENEPTTTEETLLEDKTAAEKITDNCDCKTECICPENDSDCECKQTKTICSCTQPNGEVTVVESIDNNNSDIEELNPDETADEDETIINE